MKQFFAACALMLGIVSLSVAQEVVTGPSITLDKDVHDYGTIQQGANGTCEFTVTNSGNGTLNFSGTPRVDIIGDVEFTVTVQLPATIAGNGTTTFTVEFDPTATGTFTAQVSIANAAFLPSSEEIDRARRLLEAYDDAKAQGVASVAFEGQMVDEPVARQARRVLAQADD